MPHYTHLDVTSVEARMYKMLNSICAGTTHTRHPLLPTIEKLVKQYSTRPFVHHTRGGIENLIQYFREKKRMPNRFSADADEKWAFHSLQNICYNGNFRSHPLLPELEPFLVHYKPGFVSFETTWAQLDAKKTEAYVNRIRETQEQGEIAAAAWILAHITSPKRGKRAAEEELNEGECGAVVVAKKKQKV